MLLIRGGRLHLFFRKRFGFLFERLLRRRFLRLGGVLPLLELLLRLGRRFLRGNVAPGVFLQHGLQFIRLFILL